MSLLVQSPTQVALYLRYIDSQCTVQERFIGLLQVSKTDSESLKQPVKVVLLYNWRMCVDRGTMELLLCVVNIPAFRVG